MQSSEGTFQGDAGLELYYQSWHPADQPKAVIVILHGVAEHSDRYLNVVDNLVPLGYAIYAYDQRGHGKSPGQRGYIFHRVRYLPVWKFPILTKQTPSYHKGKNGFKISPQQGNAEGDR